LLIQCEISVLRLAELELELIEVLCEWEQYFPFFTQTINFHLVLRLSLQISRCGPCPFFWMYALERECGRLVDGIHSMKVPEESLVQEYLLRELMEHRHVADPHYSNPLFRREGAANDALLPLYQSCKMISADVLG